MFPGDYLHYDSVRVELYTFLSIQHMLDDFLSDRFTGDQLVVKDE